MKKDYKLIFAGCFYGFFVNGMLALMLGAIMPMLLTDFNMGYDMGGMLLSSHSMGNLAAGFLGGVIPVYLGRKNSIVMLSSMTVLGFGGMLFTKSPSFLIILFLMTGIGRGSVSNLNNVIVNDISDGKPGALNVLHTFFAVGAFIAPFLASWCVASGLGWRYAAGTVAVLGAIMVVVYSLLNIDNTRGKKKEKSKSNGNSLDFLKNVDFYLSCGLLFFYVGVESAVNGWIVTYLKDTGIMSTSLAQTVLSILWIVIIFGRLFCAYISKTVDKRTILLFSSIGSLLFFVLFMMTTNIYVIVACQIGLGFFLAGIYPTAIANVGGAIKGSGLAMGILLAVAGLGGITMPYITGLIAERSGIVGGMTAITVAAVLMVVCALLNKMRTPKVKKPQLYY